MSRSRAAFFTARFATFAGAAAIMIAVPLLGANSSGADTNQPPPTTSTSATTNGHMWDD